MPTAADVIREGNEFTMAHVYALEAQHVNELYRAYLSAYREIQQQVTLVFEAMVSGGTWSLSDITAKEVLLQQIAQQLASLDGIAAAQILDYGTAGYRAGYYGAGYALDTGILEAMGMNPAYLPILTTEAIRAQVLAPYAGQSFVETVRDNRTEFELKIKRALTQSQAQGDTIYQAQKRIADALGIQIGRRTKADRASNKAYFARTEMIARTELLRASNNGALAVYEANRDVLQGWEWKVALDDRACPQCAPLDGKQFAFGEMTRPPLHPRCRCAVLPVLMDRELERAIVGERKTFSQWAEGRGLTQSAYGQAYLLRGKQPPKKPELN